MDTEGSLTPVELADLPAIFTSKNQMETVHIQILAYLNIFVKRKVPLAPSSRIPSLIGFAITLPNLM
jgi:hypothetical protein